MLLNSLNVQGEGLERRFEVIINAIVKTPSIDNARAHTLASNLTSNIVVPYEGL